MKIAAVVAGAVLLAAASFALGQDVATGRGLVGTYDSLADVILGAKKTEKGLVQAILEGHRGHAAAAMAKGDAAKAAAEMALFANEGDNAVGGIRKRLLEGGHHHNAEGEAKGVYEEGYVTVTRACKAECLAAVKALQAAADDAGRQAAWKKFEAAAASVLK
jgi:hypothetical protein